MIDEIHTLGFYHNDIKPDNIILQRNKEIKNNKISNSTKPKWIVKLIDFTVLTFNIWDTGGSFILKKIKVPVYFHLK